MKNISYINEMEYWHIMALWLCILQSGEVRRTRAHKYGKGATGLEEDEEEEE